MIVQIYTMQSIAQGVDHIGVTPSDIGLPGEVDFTTARAIIDSVGDAAVCVALSVESDLDAIEAMVQSVQPDILHLCGLENSLSPAKVHQLRERIPNMPIMQAISVAGSRSVDVALAYQDVADYLILDTQAAHIAGIGASGETHD